MPNQEDLTAKIQYFSNLWQQQKDKLTPGQKDSIGLAYLEHVIGADKETIIDFSQEKYSAKDFIGRRQSRAEKLKEDYAGFWPAIAQIVPDTYSPEDLAWLIQNSEHEGAWQMLLYLDDLPKGVSLMLNKLKCNAHAYKY